jgi:hypothetical protein
VHGELEWIWKEDKWYNLRYPTGICLEELREIAKTWVRNPGLWVGNEPGTSRNTKQECHLLDGDIWFTCCSCYCQPIIIIIVMWLIIDGVSIGNWIYELLQNVTTNNYSANSNSHSLQHVRSLLDLLYLHRLSPGNGFQHRSFLSFSVNVLTVWRLSPN